MHFLQAINSDLSVLIVCNKTGGIIKGCKRRTISRSSILWFPQPQSDLQNSFQNSEELTVIKTLLFITCKYLRILSFGAKHIAVAYILSVFLPFFSLFPLIFYYSLFIYFCLLNSFCFGFLFSFADGIVVLKYKQNFSPQVCVRTASFIRKDFLLGVILHSLREVGSYCLAKTTL